MGCVHKCLLRLPPCDPQLAGVTVGKGRPGRAGPALESPDEEEEQPLNHNGDVAGEHAEGEQAFSPRHRLRDWRAYWGATMRQMGLVCALTLSVISGGFRMDWDPDKGPAPSAFLRNHPSALAEVAFVTEAIAAGIAARTMRASSTRRGDELICILPLGVAFNSALKRRLIWDGRHVNRHLRPLPMETLQREGRALFERSSFGGTLNISSANHHLDMAQDAFPYLGFEWGGSFYCFESSLSGSRPPRGYTPR